VGCDVKLLKVRPQFTADIAGTSVPPSVNLDIVWLLASQPD
jgi:hypothetical protein